MKIQCEHCPRRCALDEGQRGVCYVRQNLGGVVVCTAYGRSTGLCVDPIEKKPLMHFLPGSGVLSLGTVGCNLGCVYCQNWTTSQSRNEAQLAVLATPAQVARTAEKHQCASVAYTYNEPTTWSEYAVDIARECRPRGIRSVAVTNGYISVAARKDFYPWLDAVNIDLKGFSEDFYEKYCLAHLAPVLETIEWVAKETKIWMELTNLLIPRANDSLDDIQKLCDWVVATVGVDVPLHFSAFYPRYRLVDRLPTTFESLKSAFRIAKKAGLRYVYLGNVDAPAYESTYCHVCNETLIARRGYVIEQNALTAGRCPNCSTPLPGVF